MQPTAELRALALATALLGLFGCPKAPSGPDASLPGVSPADAGPGLDAGTIDAGAEADGGTDGGPAIGAELGFSGELELVDGGRAELPHESHAEIDPPTALTLHLGADLKDYRVRFLESDQVTQSDDEAQASDGGIDYRIHFLKPLKLGRTYQLVIDAQTGDELTDRAGHPFKDVELALKVRGEPEPTPGKRPKRKHH